MVALTKAEAIARVQQGLGFRSDKSDEIELELRLAQSELEKGQTLPWWLLSDTTTLSGSADTETVALPTGFLRFDEEVDLYYTAPSISPRTVLIGSPVDYSQLKLLRVDESTGEVLTGASRWVAIWKNSLIVSPIPTESFTLTGSWYVADEDIGDLQPAETNLWLTYAPLVVVGMAGMSIAADLEYGAAAEKFNAMYSMANARLIADAELRKSRSYNVGGRQ